MKKMIFAATAAIVAGVAMAPAAQAQSITTVANTCPTTTWSYGSGPAFNGYTPCNTYVQTFTDSPAGAVIELATRWHVRGQFAPASNGNTYVFALGSQPLNFDYGVEANRNLGRFDLNIRVQNLTTGEVHSFNPLTDINDNYTGGGTNLIQNSEQLGFGFLFGSNFNPNENVTYQMDLTVGGNTSTTFAQIGTGSVNPVPEPTTWAMMMLGFGFVGASLRSRRTKVAFA